MKDGWEEKMLREIGIAQTGTTPKTADKENYGDFIPFIKPADIDVTGNGEIRYNNEGLSEQGLSNGRKILEGSILMVCIGATIGKVGYCDRDISCNQQINSLTVKKEFSPKFIYYALSTKGFFEKVMQNAAQATLPIINKGKWETLTVSYPKSLLEQQRIVAILDEAFAAIAKAKANAEQNLKNTKELFESYLQSVFENKGEGWEEKTIGEITESNIIGLTRNASEQRSDYKYKYVKMNNITRDNRFDLSKFTLVNATQEEAKKYSLSEGDFLFNTRNSYELVGKTCLFEGNEDEVILYNNNIMRIRFIKSVNSHFINYSFTTKNTIKKLDGIKSGTTNVSAIYFKDLKNLHLLIPPLKTQQTIVQKLDVLSVETKKLESIYQQKINDLEELKKSILQKAFSGELKTTEEMAV